MVRGGEADVPGVKFLAAGYGLWIALSTNMTEPNERIHHRVTWAPLADTTEIIRSSVGGYPIVPTGESWPSAPFDSPGVARRMRQRAHQSLDQRQLATINRQSVLQESILGESTILVQN